MGWPWGDHKVALGSVTGMAGPWTAPSSSLQEQVSLPSSQWLPQLSFKKKNKTSVRAGSAKNTGEVFICWVFS